MELRLFVRIHAGIGVQFNGRVVVRDVERSTSDEVSEPDAKGFPAGIEPLGALSGTFEFLFVVATTRPLRVGACEAPRADGCETGRERADQGCPVLAFQGGDQNEAEMLPDDDRRRDGGGQSGGSVVPERIGTDDNESEGSCGERDEFNRDSAFLGPIHIIESKDEGELVKDEGCSGADHDRGQFRPPSLTVCSNGKEAASRDEDHSRHRVVDVEARVGNVVVEGSAARTDRPRDQSGDNERDNECDKGQEQRQPADVDDVLIPPRAHYRHART
jgi:hypothetical protein